MRALLCDLGGVVIWIDPDRIRRGWAARSSLPDEEVHRAYPDRVYEAFERDEVSEAEYLTHVRTELSLTGSDEDLLGCFNDLYLGVDDEVVELLRELRDRGVWVGALTNTNRAHHRIWSVRFAEALEVFEAVHCSFELKARKPEPEAFRRVLAIHGLAPQETVFVDDVAEYVEAGARIGLHGVRFSDATALVDQLGRVPWARLR